MRSVALSLMLVLAAGSANAKMFSVSELPTGPGSKMIFQLFDDAPTIQECKGSRSSGVLVDVEVNGRMDRYGTGCWQAGMDGNISMWIKRYDDGGRSGFTIHNSQFAPVND